MSEDFVGVTGSHGGLCKAEAHDQPMLLKGHDVAVVGWRTS